MRKRCVILLLALSSWAGMAPARDNVSSSWESLNALSAGARIEVVRRGADAVSGKFTVLTADSIGVQMKARQIAVPRADVLRVRLRRKGRGKWIGLAIGAGAGAGTGAGLGTRLANESAGDINIRAASTVGVAAAGALIGLAIGATLDGRNSTIYSVK